MKKYEQLHLHELFLDVTISAFKIINDSLNDCFFWQCLARKLGCNTDTVFKFTKSVCVPLLDNLVSSVRK